jgi:putative transcriptional regulator
LRDWEQGVHLPDSTAKAYLRVIERNPKAVLEALRPAQFSLRERVDSV